MAVPEVLVQITVYHSQNDKKNYLHRWRVLYLGVRRFCRQKKWKNRLAKAKSKMLVKIGKFWANWT